MRPVRPTSTLVVLTAIVAVVSLAAAGCGGDDETTTATGTTGATGATGAAGATGDLSEIQANLEEAGYSVSPGKGADLSPTFASLTADEGLTVSGEVLTFAFVLSFPDSEDAETVAGIISDWLEQQSSVKGQAPPMRPTHPR